MSSIIPGYAYDVFISYRLKDNKYDGWVTDFVANLTKELEATFKESVNVYFDENPHDGLQETHDVHKSLEGKLKCLVFVPIISQTYCDPNSFAWQHELLAFHGFANKEDGGLEVRLANGNVASRILPVRIHEIDPDDRALLENLLGHLRSVDFIFKSPGINRSLTPKDDEVRKHGQVLYRDQVNKVANALKEVIYGLRNRSKSTAAERIKPLTFAEPSVTPHTRKTMAIGGGALILLLIAGYYILNRSATSTTFSQGLDKSIAVLPFKNFSQEDKGDYFSDGMTEEVTNYLAKVRELKVISHTSTNQYKGAYKNIRTIADELGVSYVLEGSVRKAGNVVRISVQLIEAETGFHVWSDEYDRDITDVLQVQSDISKQVTDRLKIVLTASEINNIENVPAVELSSYDFYLKARSELMNYRIAGPTKGKAFLENAIALFKRSIAIDPKFARAYSGLGLALTYKGHSGTFLIVFNKPSLDSAGLVADKALELDDKIDEGHYVKGIHLYLNGNSDGAILELDKALRINPNFVEARMDLGQIYLRVKADYVAGLSNMNRAIQLGRGPELAPNLRSIGNAYLWVGLYDKSEQFLMNATRLDKDSAELFNLQSHIKRIKLSYKDALLLANKAYALDSLKWSYADQKAWLLTLMGNNQDALATWLDWQVRNNDQTAMQTRIGYSYWALGNKKKAMEYFNRRIKISERSIDLNEPVAQSKFAQYELAGIYAHLGSKEKAYEYLEDVSTINFFDSWMIALIKVDPLFEKIRGEDRFKNIVIKMEAKTNAERERVERWLEQEEMNEKMKR